MFELTEDKTIVWLEDGESGIVMFDSEEELMRVADRLELSRLDLESIWNEFAEAVPFDDLKPVKKFRNRPFGVRRIWEVIQRLKPEQQEQKEQKPAVSDAPAEEKPAAKPERKNRRKKTKGGKARKAGKREIVLKMLRSGVTGEQIMKKTGWQRHSVRGYLSTLRSKHGFKIETEKTPEGTKYSLKG